MTSTLGIKKIQYPNGTNIATLDSSGSIAFAGASTVAGTLGVTGAVTANAGVVVDNITIDGTEIDLSSGDLTIDVAGDIILDADGGDVKINDGGSARFHILTSATETQLFNQQQDADIVFKGDDGGSAITALTLDMSDAGTAIFNHDAKITSGNIQFGASGSETGQIEISSTRLLLRSTGDASGLRFDGSSYTPFKNGSQTDNAVDLGFANARFKDLYLSSGVFLGGTGTANKLDDYEEGTFTPNFLGSGDNYNPTHTFRFGQYTKIGDTVYFTLRCASSSRTENGDQIYISGLPFSANYGNSGISDGFPVRGNGMKIDFGVGYVYGNMTHTNSVITLLMQGYNVGNGSGIDNFRQHDMHPSHDVRISGFYKTTA